MEDSGDCYLGTNPTREGFTLITSSNFNYLPNIPPPHTIALDTLCTFHWCRLWKLIFSNVTTEGFSSYYTLRRDCVFHASDVHAQNNACKNGPNPVLTVQHWNELSKDSVSLYDEENESSGKRLIEYLQSFNNSILTHQLIRKSYKAIYRCSVETFRTKMLADTFGQTFDPYENSTKKSLLWSPKCMRGNWGAGKLSNLCRVTELLSDRIQPGRSSLS